MPIGLAQKVTRQDLFGHDKITELVRNIAIDNARQKFATDTFTKMTDSSTGTANTVGTLTALTVPAAFVHVTGSDLAPKAGFDTALGKIANAAASVAANLNTYRAALGLPIITRNDGAVTAAVAAFDKTLSGVDGSGTDAVEALSGQTQIKYAMDNLATLIYAANEVLEALGYRTIADNSGGSVIDGLTLYDQDATGTGVAGTATAKSLSDTAVDTWLTAMANNYATLLYFLNFAIDPDEDTNLTDNSGGTASTSNPPEVAEINDEPALYQAAGTDTAPHAAFNTECPKIDNNFADLVLKINDLIRYQDSQIGFITDSTGASANTTLEVIDDTLTAVDGSANSALSNAEARTILAKVANNFATLTDKVNEISAYYGMPDLVNNSGGTTSTTGTIVSIGTAAAGVTNTGSAIGVADAVMDAILDVITDNFATIAARLNALDNIGGTRPLRVVAGL